DPLFCNNRGSRIARFGALHHQEALRTSASGDSRTSGQALAPHNMRHSAAVHLRRSGVDIHGTSDALTLGRTDASILTWLEAL
ncbi:MAG TPA: hypothetical protein VGL89_02775, partial [Candidatus Koribacter sp.]